MDWMEVQTFFARFFSGYTLVDAQQCEQEFSGRMSYWNRENECAQNSAI
jgi:hypothetical protein